MVPRRFLLPYFVALLAVGVTACAPTPTPAPTPTASGFASEDEAFAAAEETYRVHVDELNAYYAGENPDYDPALYLSGEPLAEEKTVLSQMTKLGLTVQGEIEIRSLEAISAKAIADAWTVTLRSCLDSSNTVIADASGADVTPERDDTLVLDVELATIDRMRLVIVKSTVDRDAEC